MATSSSEPLHYQYEYIDYIPKKCFCKQCKRVAREASTTICCGKTFCKECIEAVIQKKGPCPSCQDKQLNSNPSKLLQDHISKLRVRCLKGRPIDEVPQYSYGEYVLKCIFSVSKLSKGGCEWTGQLQHLNTHTDPTTGTCDHVDVDCPKGCKQKVQKHNMGTHLIKECPNRKLEEQGIILEQKLREQQEVFDQKLLEQQQSFEQKLLDQQTEHKAMFEENVLSNFNGLRLATGVPPYKITIPFNGKKCSSPILYAHPRPISYTLCLSKKVLGNDCCAYLSITGTFGKVNNGKVYKEFSCLTITIKLLNQHRDRDHIEKVVRIVHPHYEQLLSSRLDHSQSDDSLILPIENLAWNTDKQTQYLKDDCLKLRVLRNEWWRRQQSSHT